MSRARAIAGGAAAALHASSLFLFPLAVLAGVRLLGPRATALLLLAAIVLGALLGRRTAPRGPPGLLLTSAVAVLLLVAAALDDARLMLAYPVLVNAIFLAQFAGTLVHGPPLVERIARRQVPDLSASEVRYCRTVTGVWSVFFVLNGAIAAALAVAASRVWWALYTGVLSYVLVALLFTVEYVVRKARFGRYGRGPVDRALFALLGDARAR